MGGLRKFEGASGSVRAERYFREGMLALPYNGLLKFEGASGWVCAITVLFQQSHSSISFTVTIQMARAIGVVEIRHIRMVCVIMWCRAVEMIQVQYFREGMWGC